MTISSRTTIVRPGTGAVSVVGKDPKRFTLGFNRESQIVSTSDGCMKSRDELLKVAMSRRTKRAYQLAEQTCRYLSNLTICIVLKFSLFAHKSTHFVVSVYIMDHY